MFFTIKFFYPSRSLSLTLSLSLYRSLSITPSHSSLRSWLLISFKTFLYFYYIQIFTLFPIQTLWLGIFSISLDFVVLKTYFWSVCFCLDSNFVHTPLFTLSILNFCGFCSWIWNAMSKLNLWFCVLHAFNVIAGAFASVFQLNEWLRRVQIGE